MAKYIINCKDPNKISTNESCELCKNIDKAYMIIENLQDEEEKQRMLNSLEGSLVDGYHLLKIYETGGKGPISIIKMNEIKNYYTITDGFLSRANEFFSGIEAISNKSIDSPVILHSRWCKICGSRKKDIYDSDRIINEYDLKFANFIIDVNESMHKVYIYWEDPTSICISKIKLYKRYMNDNVDYNCEDVDLCLEYNIENKNCYEYPNGYLDENVFFNYESKKGWYYKLYAFDKFENVIAASEVKEIYI